MLDNLHAFLVARRHFLTNLYHLRPDILCFVNGVDPDQMASDKPADQDLQCFPLCKYMHKLKSC